MTKEEPTMNSSTSESRRFELLALSINLTPIQIAILKIISRLELATEKDLSSSIEGPKYKTIGYHVRKLEKMGLLQKIHAEHTARNKPRAITDKGREVLRYLKERNIQYGELRRIMTARDDD